LYVHGVVPTLELLNSQYHCPCVVFWTSPTRHQEQKEEK
jgi:hypothetical protein